MQKAFTVSVLLCLFSCLNRGYDVEDSYVLFDKFDNQEYCYVKNLPPVLVKSILRRNPEINEQILAFLDKTKHIRILKTRNEISKLKLKNTRKSFEEFCKKKSYQNIITYTDKIGLITGDFKSITSSQNELIIIMSEKDEVFIMSLKGEFIIEDSAKLEANKQISIFRSLVLQFFE